MLIETVLLAGLAGACLGMAFAFAVHGIPMERALTDERRRTRQARIDADREHRAAVAWRDRAVFLEELMRVDREARAVAGQVLDLHNGSRKAPGLGVVDGGAS